jgi:regulator of cell morphogenesis and NO signaling
MAITPSDHVADIVTAAPGTIAVFQRHHIEFCCAGRVPLEQVCEHEGLDLSGMIEELTAATQPFGETRNWQDAPLAELVAHIQASYHQPLYHELPRLAAMLAKVVQRHGDRLPDTLQPLQATFSGLERDLVFHMRREDAILFPAVLRVASHADLGLASPHSLLEPITAMEHEHADVDDALATMRSLTSAYEPPPDACPTFRGLYYGLSELEYRMHLHMRLENDILFPRALALGTTG